MELKKTGDIWEEIKKLEEEYDFLLVKFPSLADLYVIFLSSKEEMHTAIIIARSWAKTSIGDSDCYCYRNIGAEGNKKETIKALKEVWGEVEVEEDPATVTTIPKR
ncbi:MAG: hypothetical protein Q8N68_00965 [bacterium]|nr:hypothetical protein [bacterium]